MVIDYIKKPSFELLAKGTNFELRIYPPAKRTVKIVGRNYFLQFPYVIFGKYFVKDEGSWLHIAFTDRKLTRNSLSKMVYLPSVGNILSDYWYACLDFGPDGHYRQFHKLTFEDLICKFWNNEFSMEDSYESPPLGGRYHAWQKMSLDEVLKAVSKIEYKMSLSRFIGIVRRKERHDF